MRLEDRQLRPPSSLTSRRLPARSTTQRDQTFWTAGSDEMEWISIVSGNTRKPRRAFGSMIRTLVTVRPTPLQIWRSRRSVRSGPGITNKGTKEPALTLGRPRSASKLRPLSKAGDTSTITGSGSPSARRAETRWRTSSGTSPSQCSGCHKIIEGSV